MSVAAPIRAAKKRKASRRRHGAADALTALMTPAEEVVPDPAGFVLRTRPAFDLDEDEFFQFCQLNGDLRLERTAEGAIIVMPPTGTESGSRNVELAADFVFWIRKTGDGKVTDSSGGYRLPNGAVRAPDVAWVSHERLAKLTKKQWQQFAPICPDFVLELRSRTDRLPVLQRKMAEYIANGAQLGWLIDPVKKQVFVYRPGAAVEHLKNPQTLSGEPVLAGFTLELSRIWDRA